jgi:hypothetical protein
MPMRAFSASIVGVIALLAHAGDEPATRYLTAPVNRLEILEGSLPTDVGAHSYLVEQFEREVYRWGRPLARGFFRVRLDQPGEADLIFASSGMRPYWSEVYLVLKTTSAGPITGRCSYGSLEGNQVPGASFRFRVPANVNTVRAADWFEYAQARRTNLEFSNPFVSNLPGAAWFRHRLMQAAEPRSRELAFLWKKGSNLTGPQAAPLEPTSAYVDHLDFSDLGRNPGEFARNWNGDASELLSGGRAIAENLQLDRQLNVRGGEAGMVRLADLAGISIREFDWGPVTRGLRPALDPLADVIPADQHAVFFPRVLDTITVMQELDKTGLAILHMATVSSTEDRVSERYQRQLGILNPELGKLIPPALVSGVAITGSDLYFDTGTDMAIVYATDQPSVVAKLITMSWPLIKGATPDAVENRETVANVSYRALRAPDRVVSALVAELPGLVILTNSPVQIRRIVEVRAGKSPPIASLPEYVFFRDRYRRGEADESAFALLSDATIRRWCGPKWRIAHHRRLMTGSALAAAQAAHLVEMQSLKEPRTVDYPGLGPITVSARGVSAPGIGSRLFQTPISEVDVEVVTLTEAEAYRQWRDSYQQNWSRYFDPIAVRLSVRPDRIAADMTVMPLIAQSQYSTIANLSAGAKLPPTAGDPHPESLLHLVLGFNRHSEAFQRTMGGFEGFVKTSDNSPTIRSWIGDWLAIYADQDPLWDEFVKEGENNHSFWDKHDGQIPVAIAIAVRDSTKQAEFLKSLKSVLFWSDATTETRKYGGVKYLRVANSGLPSLFSLSLSDQWVITPSERIVHRVIDRDRARKEGKASPMSGFTWIGDSMAFSAKPEATRYLHDFMYGSNLHQLRVACWANLPILNEWHRLDASGDPAGFHEKWWGERLLCPAGGKYVWNAADGTMESSILGHPGRPKNPGAISSPFLRSLRDAQMGVTFQMDGLRARVDVRREP